MGRNMEAEGRKKKSTFFARPLKSNLLPGGLKQIIKTRNYVKPSTKKRAQKNRMKIKVDRTDIFANGFFFFGGKNFHFRCVEKTKNQTWKGRKKGGKVNPVSTAVIFFVTLVCVTRASLPFPLHFPSPPPPLPCSTNLSERERERRK